MENMQQKPTMQQRLIKWGIAKNESQATYILLGIAVLAIALAFLWPKLAGLPT